MLSTRAGKTVTDRFYVIGLMSGTSGDGVDAALVQLQLGNDDDLRPRVSLLAAHAVPYDKSLKQRLFPLFDVGTARVDHICDMNVRLAEHFAAAAIDVAAKANMTLDEVDVIGSHGQTIHHLPPKPPQTGSTLQIGEPSVIAELTGVPVVSNFRARDMAAGGQGAPLIPYVDWLLLGKAGERQAVQNIGGIGNVTVLPETDHLDDVIAFDTGPGNMIIDALVRFMSEGREGVDWDGKIARSGNVIREWLAELLQHEYYGLEPPKSTGREQFGTHYAAGLWAQGKQRGYAAADMVATVTELTASTIADHYRRFVLPGGSLTRVILGGGGAENTTLVNGLKRLLPGIHIVRHEEVGWPSDAKEAIAFAVLAWAAWVGWSANVPSVTGAAGPRRLGTITLP